MIKKKFSLISVYKKDKLEEICKLFKKNNIEIISTGSTAIYIKKLGFNCLEVSNFTKFEEILDGRVKTLHPLIHASLLYDRKNKSHQKTFKKFNFPEISFVIVNLYPFAELINLTKNKKQLIEMIDIGGTTLLRSAAKNYDSVTAISTSDDYNIFIQNMKLNKGNTTLNFRKRMATKVFRLTSMYDNLILNWMENNNNNLMITNHKKQNLRYGENPHQKSFFYKKNLTINFLDNCLTQNKKLSFNNLSDINSAYDCLQEFQKPTCVIIKHNTPCAVASNININRAFLNAYNSDSTSAFGGIVAFNRKVDEKLSKLLQKNFIEIVIAPNYSKKGLSILKRKKRLIIINISKIKDNNNLEIKSLINGYLIQEKNLLKISKKIIKCKTKNKASAKQIDDLIFALKVSKHAKSNAIVLCSNQQTIGISSGQTSRIDATKIAVSKIPTKYKKIGFVAASDAFFPFVDGLKLLIRNNCKAIIQPKGSINDYKILDYANLKNTPLYFSKYRFFKH